MKYRKLGKSDIVVSEIGFGAWGIGGSSGGHIAYGSTDDNESCLALRLAYDLGITFYDTSDFYGHGHSETLIGKTFKDARDKIVIATKVGLIKGDGTTDFSLAHIKSSLEKSLRRLQTDYIDVYQLHNPPIHDMEKNGEIMITFQELIKQGKVRLLGISTRSPDDALKAVKKLGFKVVQVNFNLVDQRVLLNGLFDYCESQGIGIISRTPLCFGFLTGNYSKDSHFDTHDHRRYFSDDQLELWEQAISLFRKDVPAHDEMNNAHFALRFCLSHPAISSVIPGMLNRKEVKENVASSEFGPLPGKILAIIKKVYSKTSFVLDTSRFQNRL